MQKGCCCKDNVMYSFGLSVLFQIIPVRFFYRSYSCITHESLHNKDLLGISKKSSLLIGQYMKNSFHLGSNLGCSKENNTPLPSKPQSFILQKYFHYIFMLLINKKLGEKIMKYKNIIMKKKYITSKIK